MVVRTALPCSGGCRPAPPGPRSPGAAPPADRPPPACLHQLNQLNAHVSLAIFCSGSLGSLLNSKD